MHIWSALVVREAALLAMLLLLGAGPASFLSDRIDLIGRVALAPVLGFCLGTCVTTTVLWFAPVHSTYWLLIPLAVGSAAVAALRTRRHIARRGPPRAPRAADVLGLLLVCIAVAVPTSRVLHERATVGPASFNTTDVDNYVGVQDAAQTTSLQDAERAYRRYVHGFRFGNLTQLAWSAIVHSKGNLDATPLDANMNALLGLGATDTWAPFLVILQLAGGLGAFAATRYLTESRTWIAALAGALFGGPFFIELWFDGFQAALIGVGLLMPLAVLAFEAVRTRARTEVVSIALVLATMLTVYPLFVPALLFTAAIVLAWHGLAIQRSRGSLSEAMRWILPALATVAVLTIVFDLVGFTRDLSYYRSVLENKIALPRLNFVLPPGVIPGWVAQTREFWDMPNLGIGGAGQFVTGALFPLVFIGFIVAGLRRRPAALVLVVLAAVCGLIAIYSYHSREACTYCAERNLLPLAPITAVLVTVGLATLLTSRSQVNRVVGVLGVALVAVSVGVRASSELDRFRAGAYFLDSANRAALAHLPERPGAIEVEAYGGSPYAAAEQPLVYHLVNERSSGRASIILGTDLGNALQYLDNGGAVILPPGPEFKPDYPFVLTRLGGVETDRQIIVREGGIALERRIKPLDLTPYSGLSVNVAHYDKSGLGYVQTDYPLSMYVTGRDGGRAAWARLTFTLREPVHVPVQPLVRVRQHGSTLIVCARATGNEPIRQVTVRMSAAPLLPPPPAGFARPEPSEGIVLTGMQAVTDGCRL
jgi:hypothetical protein